MGACRGVLATIAPGVPLADISHLVPSFDIDRGARMLEASLPYYPPGSVHVGVVDPGVGTSRRGIALRCGRGDHCVGPDNGLLMWAAERLGGVTEAVELSSDAHRLHPTSRTFHGRDIFAPAAAHLALGLELAALGPRLDPSGLVRLPRTGPEVGAGSIRARVGSINGYGTCQFDVVDADWERAGLAGHPSIVVEVSGGTWTVPYVLTFGEIGRDEPLLFPDSSGKLSLAVNQASAAQRFGLGVGGLVTFRAGEDRPTT